jgi:BASS family bile acid:Na+ symporter
MPIHDRLVWYVLAAAALGLLLPDAAAQLQSFVPLMLAGQVAGVALTLAAQEFTRVARRPWVPLAALLVQWICFPVAGLLMQHVATDATVGHGALIVAVAPAEITSALIAIVAGGSGALAISCMAGSLALSTLVTPLWLAFALGGATHVDESGLVVELLLSVLLPLCLGVAIRTAWPVIDRYHSWWLDLAAVSVVLVVFVGAGSARSSLNESLLVEAVSVCLILLLTGLGLGTVTGFLLRLQPTERRAVLFPIGMREFGVATAVALVVDPAAAGICGLYGIALMAGSAALATRLRQPG